MKKTCNEIAGKHYATVFDMKEGFVDKYANFKGYLSKNRTTNDELMNEQNFRCVMKTSTLRCSRSEKNK